MSLPALVRALEQAWPYVAGALSFLLALLASAHVVLNKRDGRAAVGWVGLILLAPVIGAVLYWGFGINRIRRRAAAQRGRRAGTSTGSAAAVRPDDVVALPAEAAHLRPLARLVQRLAGRPLAPGNSVTPLIDGDEAYPAMLAAIDGAARSVVFSTYIFDHDSAGELFLEALERAVRRGVEIRVLIDAVGGRYSWPQMLGALRRRGVPAAAFGPTILPWRMPYFNLRNHRKILVVDGRVGFTGGMNIRAGHLSAQRPRFPIRDLHFRLEGPVVQHLTQAFAADWAYTTRETLTGDAWQACRDPVGPVIARGLVDGPDEDFEQARFTRLGALTCARESVRIVTPYFLPDEGLISELGVTAMRGVRVDIVLPAVSNLMLVQWAAQAQLWQVLTRECRVFITPPPFDHTKLMLVDGVWSLFGSANWDARSLRLNFELDVEAYDRQLAARLNDLVEDRLRLARPLTLGELENRSVPVKLRDGLARLAAPYL